jgi:2-phosphosulfolactate phosphatase
MPLIEVCFTPSLYGFRSNQDGVITVVIDVLRATTAFCAALDAGAKDIVPVDSLEKLKELKSLGYLAAAERDGLKVDFADFGNSPLCFLQSDLKGKSLAYSTTNGTNAVELAKASGSIAIASFSNLEAVNDWLISQKKDLILLCSGWKNSFSLEDSVCAGALADLLIRKGNYSFNSDSVFASVQLWMQAQENLQEFCSHGSHYQRLENLGLQDDLNHCFRLNSSRVVPVWDGEKIVRSDFRDCS